MMRFIVLIFILLLTVSGVSSQDDTPYIYYYDTLQNGLVIERADGTDSRIIPDLLPENHNVFIWYGWSPSGRYFALGSYYSTGEPAGYLQDIQIISVDGQERFKVEQYRYYSFYTLWANTTDRLLITGLTPSTGQLSDSLQAQIIDVETQTIRNALNLTYWGRDITGIDHPEKLYWSDDDETTYIQWPGKLLIMQWDGQAKLVELTQYSGPFDFNSGRLIERHFLRDEWRSTVLVIDVDTEQTVKIEEEGGWPASISAVRWSPTLDHALMYAKDCAADDCPYSLRLLDWMAGTVTVLYPTVRVSSQHSECFYYDCVNLWSPNGRFAVMTGDDDDVWLLDAQTQSMQQIACDVQHYQWTPDNKLEITYPDSNVWHYYNPVTTQETHIEVSGDVIFYGSYPSPDGQLIGLVSAPPTIIDRNGNVVLQTLQHSHSFASSRYPGNGYIWHPDQQWVMADYHISFAGGGGGPDAAVVFNVDGTVRRELPTGGEPGFLPDRVIPYLPAGQPITAKKEPVWVLQQVGDVSGVGWHPTNPDQLVTYSDDAGLIFWSLAGDEPEIINQTTWAARPREHFPYGLKLFWLPERDIVAFDWFGTPKYINTAGDTLPIEDIDYPQLINSDTGTQIQYTLSGDIVPIDTNIEFNGSKILNSRRDGYILEGRDFSTYYLKAKTGELTHLEVPDGIYWTGDARDDLIVVGGVHDPYVYVLNSLDGSLIDRFHNSAYSLAFSSDGRWLATTSNGMTAIWDMAEYMGD